VQRASHSWLIKRFCDTLVAEPRPGDSESTLHHRFANPETPGGSGPVPYCRDSAFAGEDFPDLLAARRMMRR